MTSNEATRKWQAESLVKRLLEESDYASIVAASFDLACHEQFEEAISTLSNSKDRAIKRACADGFADFAGQVDAALEHAPKVEKARQVLLTTASSVRAGLLAEKKQRDFLEENERKLQEVRAQRQEVETCIRWLKLRRQIEKLDEDKKYSQALQMITALTEEIRTVPSSQFAKLRISSSLGKVQIKQKCEQELNQWMVHALDRGRELGFSKLARDVKFQKQTILRARSSSSTTIVPHLVIIDKSPVERFFSIHRKDYAEEQYSSHRLPALRQTISALGRATTASALMEERVVRFRNSLAEICGFFLIEHAVGALSKGEMAEVWYDCSAKLLEALQTGYPNETQAEIAETIACDVARTCLWIDMDAPDLVDFFAQRQEQLRLGWISRSLATIRDYCHSKHNKKSLSGGSSAADADVLPFCIKTRQELLSALVDLNILERFLGTFKIGGDQAREQLFEKECVDKALREVLTISSSSSSAASAKNELEDALFVYRAARELGSESPSSKESFFETETLARERIENLFVQSKVDRLMEFTFPQDFVPSLTATTRLEPHQCITRMLAEIESSFSQDPSHATKGEMNNMPREVRSSLLAETMGRLAELLERQILTDAEQLNPLGLKLFSLDVLAIEQLFPDHAERFAHLSAALLPFCTEGGLEMAVMEASTAERERFVAILKKFKELDSSSRLFAPPALKKKVVDLREHEAKKYLSLLMKRQ